MGMIIFIGIFVILAFWMWYEYNNPFVEEEKDEYIDAPMGTGKKIPIVQEPIETVVEEPVKPTRKRRVTKTSETVVSTTGDNKTVRKAKNTVKK